MNASACYYATWMEHENAEIARGLRRRDAALLDRLIEQYQHRLFRYLVYLTGNRANAEDLFQDTWIRVLERGSQFDGKHEFSTWLFSVARNLAIDLLRRKQPASLDPQESDSELPTEVADASQPSAFDVFAQREQSERVLAMLCGIPAEYREVIVLRFHEGLSLEEISQVTAAPLGTVKSRLYRGMNALLPRLKGLQQ
jgi:RNA polymerase sigma-70 factor (ECF subfamily)